MFEGYYLVAYVVNAQSHETAEVLWAVASQAVSGSWWTTEGQEIWPFYTEEIKQPTPSIPEGWLDELATKAASYASQHKEPPPTALALLTKLGLGRRPPTITRRV